VTTQSHGDERQLDNLMADLDPYDDPSPRGLGVLAVFFAVLVGLIAASLGYLAVDRRQPSYLSTAAVLLDQPTAIAASQDSGVVDKLSRLRFKYAAILRSDAVVDQVAAQLGLEPGVVAGAIVSRGDTGSMLLFVGGRSSTRQEAVRLANGLANGLADYVTKEQAATGLPPEKRLVLTIVAPARGAQQILPTDRQKGVTATGAGLGAAAAVLGVFGLLRRRRRI
jgi:capsular polysaccharide biosynthesis protein